MPDKDGEIYNKSKRILSLEIADVVRRYHCYTCGLVDTEGCCESCRNVCHKDHLVSEAQDSSG